MDYTTHTAKHQALLNLLVKSLPDKAVQFPPDTATKPIDQFWQTLCAVLRCRDDEMVEQVARLAELPVAGDLDNLPIAVNLLLPEATALALKVVPLGKEGDTLILAVADPFEQGLYESLRFALSVPFALRVASPLKIAVAISTLYFDSGPDFRPLGELDLDKPGEQSDDGLETQIPRLCSRLFAEALKRNASDMHIQNLTGSYVVRLRLDGVLERLTVLPVLVAKSVVRFLKVQASLDTTNTFTPQDGHISISLEGKTYDLRLSFLPTNSENEKVVVRFLNRNNDFRLSHLGMSLDEVHRLRRMAQNPSGVILLTGPTGSGKTTTLYSLLSEVNSEDISISAVEDPVEYRLPGIAQTQVSSATGLGFTDVLRSVLRQDPDIILIGEIRDGDTARIAFQAALTGHLVLSSLHTRNCFSVIPRLADMGVETQIISESLVGVVSQRLLRRLCEHCASDVSTAETPAEKLFEQITRVRPAKRSEGCEHCDMKGYRGRLVITEMFEMNPVAMDLIAEGRATYATLRASCGKHFRSLASSGARQVISGITSVDEAVRVLGRPFWAEIAAEYQVNNPDLSDLDLGSEVMEQQSVLLICENLEEHSQAIADLSGSWVTVQQVASAAEAKELLNEKDQIQLLVLDVPDGLPMDQALEYVAQARTNLAWARLPAIILSPRELDDFEQQARNAGATSHFLRKPLVVAELLEQLEIAYQTGADFRWDD